VIGILEDAAREGRTAEVARLRADHPAGPPAPAIEHWLPIAGTQSILALAKTHLRVL